MPTYGSGLSGQIGYINETTWGTPVTVTRFIEFNEESINWEPTWLDSAGLKAGQAYKRESRTKQSRFTVTGGFTVEAPDKGLGLLMKHATGSTVTVPTQIGATAAWKQNHHPGSKAGFGLTIQVGRPQTDATVKAFTYEGCKIMNWEFSCSDNELAQFAFEVDGQDMLTATALATASYTAGTGVFSFNEASTFKLGGTATTTGGETSIAGGVSVATIVRGITIRQETPMANERHGLGNAGSKAQQIENAIPTVTGTLEGEFTSQSEIYDLLKANTTTEMEVAFTHGDAGGGNPYKLSFIMPAVKFKTAAVNVGGPDILGQSIEFEAFDDGGGTNPVIQVGIVSTDVTLL